MGTNLSFHDAVNPPRWRIFGRRLQPPSAGHLLVLEQLGVLDGPVTLPILITSAIFCSRPYRLGDAFALTLRDRFLCLVCIIASRLSRQFFAKRAEMFRAYLAEACEPPPVWSTPGGDRPLGAPWLAHYITSLLALGVDIDRAFNMPISAGQWLVITAGEKRGAMQVETDHEREVMAAAERGEVPTPPTDNPPAA